jgi:hypothetical protein
LDIEDFCNLINNYLDHSLEEITNIPLLVNQNFIETIQLFLDEEFITTHIKFTEITPFDLFKLDCGKKAELIEIIKLLLDIFKDNENYQIIKADIAIFYPLCKVIYNKENGRLLKPFIFILECFHIYKIELETIWETYFFHFWVHITKELYPQSTMIFKPKLQFLTGFFKLLYHSYMKNTSSNMIDFLHSNVDHKFWNILATLHHLLSQTLPKLFHFYLSMKMNNFFYFFHHLKIVFVEVSLSL